MEKDKILNKDFIKKIILAFVGVALIGFGLAFNKMASLGNDPLAVFFDGVRNIMGLPADRLGVAVNVLNLVLGIAVFFIGRKYISFGTFIYVLPLGFLTNLGFVLYNKLGIPADVLGWRVFSVLFGCLMIFTGLAAFIVAEIGLDPWTGGIMILCDKTGKTYKFMKVTTDIIFVIAGFLLGGTAGIATLVAAVVGGPCINYICKLMDRFILEPMKIERTNTNN